MTGFLDISNKRWCRGPGLPPEYVAALEYVIELSPGPIFNLVSCSQSLLLTGVVHDQDINVAPLRLFAGGERAVDQSEPDPPNPIQRASKKVREASRLQYLF